MIGSDLYWTIVAGLATAVWVIVSTIRARNILALQHSHELMGRLLDADKVIINHPEIQKYLALTALKEEAYFRTETVLNDELFFKSKSYVYSQLNMFDDILSAADEVKRVFFLFRPPQLIELDDWEAYIVHKLRHPLYRSIIKHESHIFGTSLQTFWKTHAEQIESSERDRYSW